MKVKIVPCHKTKLGGLLKFIFLFICLLQFNSIVNAQDKKNEMGNFFISNYPRSFLKTNYLNWAVLQDSEGIIYFANSQNGVLTYDGQKVRQVLTENGEPTSQLGRSLVKDSKNTIYTIIGRSFGYIEKNELNEPVYYSLSKELSQENKVNSTLWSSGIINDTVVFQSEKSVYLYKNKKLLSAQHFDKIIHTVNVNTGGVFLRVWGDGVYKLIKGEFKYLPSTKEIFAENRIDEQYNLENGDQLLVSRNVGLWYLKKDGTIVKSESKDIDSYVKKYDAYAGGVKLEDGTIPITTTKGGVIFIDDKLSIKAILNENNGLKDKHATSLMQDRSGDVWGTNFGLFRLSFDSTTTYFSELNNLKGGVSDILRSNGKLFVKTTENLFDLVSKTNKYSTSEFKSNNVNDLGNSIIEFEDQIISTNNYDITSTKNRKTKVISSLYRSNNTIRSKLNPSIIFSSNPVYGLLAHKYSGDEWKQISLKDLDSVKPLNILEFTAGKILVDTRNGVYVYEYNDEGKGNYTKLTLDKSFTSSSRLQINLFNESDFMLRDSLNNFYKIDIYNKKALLTEIHIDSTVVGDGYYNYTYNQNSNNGWMLTSNGIYKTHFNFDNGFSFEKFPFYKVEISELSGALLAENSGDNEVLWIGSQDSKLYRYLPEIAINEKSKRYKALIRSVYSNGDKIPIESESISYKNNNLSFEVSYPVFGNESKTLFSYWLEGQDNNWSEFVPNFEKEYTNLSEGDYKFRVRAKDASGEISEEGLMGFTISPPWYRSIFAYAAYLLSLILSFIQFGKYQAKKSYNKAEDERKNSELAAAKDLQNRLLPRSLPEIKQFDIAAFLRTSTEVGGDYYDFFELQDGSLYAICGDATGHGTPSGMLVSITKAGLIGLPQMSPKDMLHELNRVVKKVDLGILRMSLNIALIKDNKLTLSSAAMPPYYIYRANSDTAEEIQISGLPLGSFNDEYFDEITTTFNPGDILVILSDGLPEAPNLSGDLFDYQKLQNLISTYGNKTAKEIIDNLVSEADKWLAGENNPDDITLVVIKHN
jgi:ligand-binding sensor domain-containing protein